MGNTTPGSQLSGDVDTDKTLTVDVLQNDNAHTPVDIIVCLVDTKWGSDDPISQAISSLAGNIYTTEREVLASRFKSCAPGEIFRCNGGNLNCKTILLVVVPDGDLNQQFAVLCNIMKTVLMRATELHANSIVFPLGIGNLFYLMSETLLYFEYSFDLFIFLILLNVENVSTKWTRKEY